MITQEKLNELKILAQNAKCGEWEASPCYYEGAGGKECVVYGINSIPLYEESGDKEAEDGDVIDVTWEVVSTYIPDESFEPVGGICNEADAEYIAATNPKMILELIAKIEEQEKQLKWLASRTVDGTCPVPANECPEPDEYKQESCVQCWLEAAKRNTQ